MSQQEITPEFCSVSDVAKRLWADSTVGKFRVYKLIESGELVATRVNNRGRWWVYTPSIDKYIERINEAAPTPPVNNAQNIYTLWPQSRYQDT